jgi:rubrerythrin
MYIRGKMCDLDEYLNQLVHSKQTDTAQKYPNLSERLNEAGQKKAAEAFDQLRRVAGVHEKLLKAVMEDHTAGTGEFYVCDVCGYIAVDQPPENCPVCNAVKEKFKS